MEISGLTRRFGGVAAVDAVSLDVAAGTVVGLIGPNGAGKTTLLSLLGGQLRPDEGIIALDGTRIDQLPAHRRCALGMVRTFQIPRPFRRLTVRENLLLADAGVRGLVSGGLAEARADALLHSMRLFDHARRPSGQLSGGQQKLLDVARALMAVPHVLLLDEPCAGVTPASIEVLSDKLVELRREGVTVVIVEHDIAFVARHCDRLVVLMQGGVLAAGEPVAICNNPVVQDAFLGNVHA